MHCSCIVCKDLVTLLSLPHSPPSPPHSHPSPTLSCCRGSPPQPPAEKAALSRRREEEEEEGSKERERRRTSWKEDWWRYTLYTCTCMVCLRETTCNSLPVWGTWNLNLLCYLNKIWSIVLCLHCCGIRSHNHKTCVLSIVELSRQLWFTTYCFHYLFVLYCVLHDVILSHRCSFFLSCQALLRMFNDSHSFYFSTEGDLTHTQQRKLNLNNSTDSDSTTPPFWQKVSITCVCIHKLLRCIQCFYVWCTLLMKYRLMTDFSGISGCFKTCSTLLVKYEPRTVSGVFPRWVYSVSPL